MEYNTDLKLFLHRKMTNPHYKPELQVQTTLINFTVTKLGVEDRLLAEVVKVDRSDLEEQKAAQLGLRTTCQEKLELSRASVVL